MSYIATINVPGYLPMADEPTTFDTTEEAWTYLAEERQRDDLAWVPDDLDDPDGPASLDTTCLELEQRAREGGTGTVYGPTPGYGWPGEDDARNDLGLAYSVDVAEETVDERAHRLDDERFGPQE